QNRGKSLHETEAARPAQVFATVQHQLPPPLLPPKSGTAFAPSKTRAALLLRKPAPPLFEQTIDLKNACKIEIHVTSFQTVEDSRSVYHKGKVLEWVDSEEYSIIDREKDVLQHYCWASNQEANFWAEMNVCDDNLAIVHEKELQIEPRIETEMQIIVRNKSPLAEAADLVWAEEPQYGVTTAGPERVEEEEKEHYMDPGFDAEGDDPLGADEEWRYFKKKAAG
ncbi:hypothetical protein EJB05_34705, partial [Eragrostis curvula]